MARAANMSYKDYAHILQAIQARMISDAPLIRVDAFCKEIGAVIGRTVTSHQIEHVLHDNGIKWRDVFQPRTVAESGKHGGKQLAELHKMLRDVEQEIRLLQTHTAEILRRLPAKSTISPTQTLFSESTE